MKKRLDVPPETAAQVLFLSDRTCCVCRKEGKYVQIHHMDEKPDNFDIDNLAVLCLDCHTDTQIKGGFHRKLDFYQVKLYRKTWHDEVAKKRASQPEVKTKSSTNHEEMLQLYKKIGDDEALANFYDALKNIKSRDKHIEKILSKPTDDEAIIYYRGMQNRVDLIPKDVIKREIKKLTEEKSWYNLARLYYSICQFTLASKYYVKSIQESIEGGRWFSTAYYIKEMNEHVTNELFKIELKKFKHDNDIWWQMRCLDELGLQSEVRELLIINKDKILKSKNIDLKREYALATGDLKKCVELDQIIAKRERGEL